MIGVKKPRKDDAKKEMTPHALPPDIRERLRKIGKADLVLGIPSYNCEETIAQVIQIAAQGAETFFPSLRPVIVVADGNSEDATRDMAREAPLPDRAERLVYQYLGPSGKGSALRSIFEAADLLQTKANITLDADLTTVDEKWVNLLAGPILNGSFDFITPYYTRHKYDGTITNSICYPLTRALYGKRVRQPIGGDFGFSTKLAQNYLEKEVWESDVARFGIDIWMTTIALNEGFEIAQASLGSKGHAPKDPAAHLGPMFKQVINTLFQTMSHYEKNWRRIESSENIPILGEEPVINILPVEVDLTAMVMKYKNHIQGLRSFWASIFSPEVMKQLEGITKLEPEEFIFPVILWVKAVYDIAVAFHHRVVEREKIVEALMPIYYGRTAAFIIETQEMNSTWAEQILENQCDAFEKMKPYLITKWSWYSP